MGTAANVAGYWKEQRNATVDVACFSKIKVRLRTKLKFTFNPTLWGGGNDENTNSQRKITHILNVYLSNLLTAGGCLCQVRFWQNFKFTFNLTYFGFFLCVWGGDNYRTLGKIRYIQQKIFEEENLSFRIASLLKCPFEQSKDCKHLTGVTK